MPIDPDRFHQREIASIDSRFCHRADDLARPALAQALKLRRMEPPRDDPGLEQSRASVKL
jgi:hypothetical protein